ncbi:cyanophycinase [Planctobacterium marinum]|uniref:Cyanophycinase n=1 Tax=Planctobacterium marinum TaxID=1631968 RepID=A0AA48HHI1_9ALTE|nr:hypothetical protein MACH26_20370 [Planctobacterium marinum]
MSTLLQQSSEDMKRFLTQLSLITLLSFSFSDLLQAQSNISTKKNQPPDFKENSWQLLIAGGGLKICSSSQPEHCIDNDFPDNALKKQSYSLTTETLSKVLELNAYQELDNQRKSQLNTLFEYFYANPTQVIGTAGIRDAFEQASNQFDGASFFTNLPNALYYAIVDFTEQVNAQKEQVKFLASKSKASQDIFLKFVEQANSKREDDETLTLLFTTASARDPFAAIDFYQQTLEQAARNLYPTLDIEVNWLPLDESLATLINNTRSCDELFALQAKSELYNRNQRYPEYSSRLINACQQPQSITNQIVQAHGLFINGGDQMRTLNSFQMKTSPSTTLATLLNSRISQNKMLLAGTSAGAAVMSGGVRQNRPVPMITSGQSNFALVRGAFALPPAPFGCEKDGNCPNGLLEDDLTYRPAGGLGLFKAGIIDTHFSERDRQGRLVTLAAFTKTQLTFGIDENTALLFRENQQLEMEVLGAGGVFIADMQDAIFKAQSGKHQLIGLSHYLNHGDRLSITPERQLHFSLHNEAQKVSDKTMVLITERGEYRRQVGLNCGTQQFHRWNSDNVAWLVNPSEDTIFTLSQQYDRETCSYINLLFGVEN